MLTVQTLETTSGRKWTENTANVAKKAQCSICQMQRTKVALYFPSAEIVQHFALSSTISPSIVLWLWLSHYAKASTLELTTVGMRTKTLILQTPSMQT